MRDIRKISVSVFVDANELDIATEELKDWFCNSDAGLWAPGVSDGLVSGKWLQVAPITAAERTTDIEGFFDFNAGDDDDDEYWELFSDERDSEALAEHVAEHDWN